MMILGVIGILYGAKLAFAQTNLKRLIAYTSISHVGFILLGIFAFNELAYQGVMMQMIVMGITTGALFIIAGQIEERLQTGNIDRMVVKVLLHKIFTQIPRQNRDIERTQGFT